MILKRIKIKNIRSYSSQEIEFPEGSLLLSGDVGAGKTSILLAIEYALFGLQPGQNSAALLRNSSSVGEVSLLCNIDEKEVLIERKLKRGSKNIANEYAAITIDGNKIECSVTELKKKILTLLCYPSEFIKKNNLLYRYTVYTPQENMKNIILEDAETRLNILRHIFGVDKYKVMRENLANALLKIKEEIKILQGEVKGIEQDYSYLDSLKNKISYLLISLSEKEREAIIFSKKIEEAETEYSLTHGKIKEKENIELEIEKTKMLLFSKKESITSLEKERDYLSEEISQSAVFDEKKSSEIIKLIENQKSLLNELQEQYINKKSLRNSLESKEREAKSEKERVFSMFFCPTCLQDVPDSHKNNIFLKKEKEISDFSKQKSALIIEEEEILNKISFEKNNLEKLEKERTLHEISKSKVRYLESANKKLIDISKKISSIKSDTIILENHISASKEGLLKFSNISPVLKIKEEALKKSESEKHEIEIKIAEIKKEKQIIEEEIVRQLDIISKKELTKSNLNRIIDISEWLSNDFLSLVQFTENNVLLQLRAEFSKFFNKWCHILSSDYFDFHIDETFTPVITQGDIEMDYSFLSGGERTAVALAYRLALNQMINSVMSQIKTKDILILDEPTEGFSEVQLEKMREVFSELNVKQLILVSHEQKIEGLVEHVLKIKKEEGASSLE